MTRGTLVISREINNHLYYKQRLEAMGFSDVTMTELEKDALNFLIHELKPKLLMMDARFYECCTPFLMGELHNKFPKIKMAALCIGNYPVDTAMYFILNGIKSYLTTYDGYEQFFKGLCQIRKGGECVSPSVLERIDLRRDYPMSAGKITDKQKEVLRLICCGFKDREIAETLAISRNTVVNHKTHFFTSLNVRSPIELVRAALTMEFIRLEEIYFYPRDMTLNPLPDKKIKKRRKE